MKQLISILFSVSISIISFSQPALKYIDPLSTFLVGQELHLDEEYEQALEYYGMIHENDSIYPTSVFNTSSALLNLGRYEECVALCKQHMEPGTEWFFELGINMGVALLRDSLYQESAVLFEQLDESYPKSYLVHYNLGLAYKRLGQTEKAIAAFKESIRCHAYYAPPHLSLGKICYKEGKLSQALLCWNTYLILNPTGGDALEVLSMANESMRNIQESQPAGIVISKDDEHFMNMDLMLKNKVALNKAFKVPVKVDFAIVKQNYALMDMLKSYSGSEGFWSQKYVPLFKEAVEKDLFDKLIFRTLLSVDNPKYTKKIAKGSKGMKPFLNWYADRWAELVGSGNCADTADIKYIYDNDGELKSIGTFDAQDEYHGWFSFYRDGRLLSNGRFNKGKRSGEWSWFYESGIRRESLVYDEHGEAAGLYKKYHENGALKSEGTLIGDAYQGEYKAYSQLGYLTLQANYKDDLLNGDRIVYHALGKDHVKQKVPYTMDTLHGTIEKYYPNGVLASTIDFNKDKRIGQELQYFYEGQLSYEYNFNDSGNLGGPYFSYFVDGNLHQTGQYAKGQKEGEWKEFDARGQLINQMNYLEGKLHGELLEYTSKGHLLVNSVYEKGELIQYAYYDEEGNELTQFSKDNLSSKAETYYANGIRRSSGLFNQEYEQIGQWDFYSPYGALYSREQYEEGKIVGIDSAYYVNGLLESLTAYREGQADGLHTEYYMNGNVKVEGYYKEGNQERIWFSYHPDGTKKEERFFKDGDWHGVQYIYTANGELMKKEHYLEGEKQRTVYFDTNAVAVDTFDYAFDGKQESYFLDGTKKIVANLANMMLNGPYRSYHPNGQLEIECQYLMGYKEGAYKEFDDQGKLKEELTYLNGFMHGEAIAYHPNGQISDKAFYVHGDRDSLYQEFSEEGVLVYETNYLNGSRHGAAKWYDPIGELQLIRYYEEGNLTAYSYLDSEGQEIPKIPIENGTAQVISYFSNGSPSREMEFFEGSLHGSYKEYHANGQLANSMNYYYGEWEGKSREYYSSGQLKRESVYANDLLNGDFVEYYENGNIKRKLRYKNGERIGEGEYYHEDGSLYKKITFFGDEPAYSQYF